MLQSLQQHTFGQPIIRQPHALALPGVLETDLSYVLSLIPYQICSEA